MREEQVSSFPSRYLFLRCRSKSRNRGCDHDRAMHVVMKRLMLVALAMGAFALGMALLVEAPGANELRLRPGTRIFCSHPFTAGCVAL